jgi:hypothetical protein
VGPAHIRPELPDTTGNGESVCIQFLIRSKRPKLPRCGIELHEIGFLAIDNGGQKAGNPDSVGKFHCLQCMQKIFES